MYTDIKYSRWRVGAVRMSAEMAGTLDGRSFVRQIVVAELLEDGHAGVGLVPRVDKDVDALNLAEASCRWSGCTKRPTK